MQIVSNGKTNFTIVIGEGASPVEQFAAEELQKYIHTMSDTIIPISQARPGHTGANLILVGRAIAGRHAPKPRHDNDDSFKIKATDSNIILCGSNDRGTLYSAYALLDKLGCRWIEPAQRGQIIPRRATV